MAGLSAAAALAPHARVTVLEAEEQVGYHSSGRSAALLHYALGNPTVRRLTQGSRSFFEHPPEGFGQLSSQLPILTPARDDEIAGLEALAADLAPFTAIEWLDADDLRRECPILRIGAGHAQRGFIDRTALKLDGHALLQGFSRVLRTNGGATVSNARISKIERTGRTWRVGTERGEGFEAPILVNAGGAWGDQLAAMAGVPQLGLQPKRRTIIVFDAPEGVDVARLPFTKTVPDDVYFGPEAGRMFASPMDEIPTDPCDAQPDDLEVALAAYRVEERTTIEVRRVVHKWAGLRTFAPDRKPVAGFAPGADGFFWLVGQGGFGLQTSPMMAAASASLIAGAPWPLADVTPAELGPGRFLGEPA